MRTFVYIQFMLYISVLFSNKYMYKFVCTFMYVYMLYIHIYMCVLQYLPAGWYHEVKSINNSSASASTDTTVAVSPVRRRTSTNTNNNSNSNSNVHMALNYWFHPPDTDVYNRPYSSDFWELDWEQRHNMTQNRIVMPYFSVN